MNILERDVGECAHAGGNWFRAIAFWRLSVQAQAAPPRGGKLFTLLGAIFCIALPDELKAAGIK